MEQNEPILYAKMHTAKRDEVPTPPWFLGPVPKPIGEWTPIEHARHILANLRGNNDFLMVRILLGELEGIAQGQAFQYADPGQLAMPLLGLVIENP